MCSKSARLITYFAFSLIFLDSFIPLYSIERISNYSPAFENTSQKINNVDKLLQIKPLEKITIAFTGDPILIPAQCVKQPVTFEPGSIIPLTARVITPDKRELPATVNWLAIRIKYDLHDPLAELFNDDNENSLTLNNISQIFKTSQNSKFDLKSSLWGNQYINIPDFIEITPDQIEFFMNNHFWKVLPFYLINYPDNLTNGQMLIDDNPVNLYVFPRQPHDLGTYGDWLTGTGYTIPDMQSPLEAFRRTLLISESSIDPSSSIPESKLIQALARRNTARVLLGINTLSQIPGLVPDSMLSKDLNDILTRTCRDGSIKFASWPTHPLEMATLEDQLIDAAIHSADQNQQEFNLKISAVKSWISSQPHTIAWLESDNGETIHLAIANLSSNIIQTTVKWHQSNKLSHNQRVHPQTVSHITINRPADGTSDSFLQVSVSTGEKWTFAIAPSAIIVEPPSIVIDKFYESWCLDTWLAQKYIINEVKPNNTRIILQRSPQPQSHWQLYIESLSWSESKPQNNVDEENDNYNDYKSPDPAISPLLGPGLVGYDALTIYVGPYNNPTAIVTISPNNVHLQTIKDWLGSDITPDSLKIKQIDNGWRALLNIPESWIQSNTIDLGFIRTFNDTAQIHCYPNPCLPWKFDPGRLRYNLENWQPMPVNNN